MWITRWTSVILCELKSNCSLCGKYSFNGLKSTELTCFSYIMVGPTKNMSRDDVLGEILDEHTEKTLTSKLNTSPTGHISVSIRLTPLNLNKEECVSPLSSHSPDKPKLTAHDKDDATRYIYLHWKWCVGLLWSYIWLSILFSNVLIVLVRNKQTCFVLHTLKT